MMINYDGRVFASIENSAGGDVGSETRFYYRQSGKAVWAEYDGGSVVRGQLIAIADDIGNLDVRYHHINDQGELMTGRCTSTPELLADGRIRLYEKWQWTSGDKSRGESVIEEVIE